MNRRMILRNTANIVKLEGVLLLLPAICSLFYKEFNIALIFVSTAAIAAFIGYMVTIFIKPKNKEIFAKDGFIIVALSWLILSLIGALPFFVSGQIPNYIDAFFETVSGFTTTGASILTDPAKLSYGLLFWRSFTHWIGGMGVLVLILAITPSASGRNMHIMRAEMPGPIIGKLVPKIKDTAKILYILYLIFTVAEMIALKIAGMTVFESLVLSFGTAGTGGFGIVTTSIGSYSTACKWIIAIFMALFGINFNLYYLLFLKRNIKAIFKSTELKTYLGIILSFALIIGFNIYPIYKNLGSVITDSFFQVLSIVTTTGYATQDFNAWPLLSKSLILLLMFIGSCAGSTAGGLKISRMLLLLKIIKKDLKKMLHPRSVASVKLEGKTVDEETLSSVSTYFIVYVALFALIYLIISFDPGVAGASGIETNISAAASCFNNIGPAFGSVASNYTVYGSFSKIVLSLAMLFGRLEIYPLLFLLVPSVWKDKN